MSGTSLDGVDVAFVEIGAATAAYPVRFQVKTIASGHRPYAERLARQLQTVRSGKPLSISIVCETHALLGWVYADAVTSVARDAGIDMINVAAIGLHGQTVWHGPKDGPIADRRHGSLQIGQPAILAEQLRVPVVSDFRAADMAAGGQGAPLIPFADYVLFASPVEARATLNLGGIANITYLPARAEMSDVIGFDTGPGNLLIDGLARALIGSPRDTGGEIALTGRVKREIVQMFLSHEYFRRPPPKSTGAEVFGAEAVRALLTRCAGLTAADALATACRITAASIAAAVHDFLPARPVRLIVGGGGVHNAALMRDIADELNNPPSGYDVELDPDATQEMRDEAPSPPPPTPSGKEAARVASLPWWDRPLVSLVSASAARHDAAAPEPEAVPELKPIIVETHEQYNIPSDGKEAIAFAILAAAHIMGVPANLPSVTGAQGPRILGVMTRPPA